MREFFPSVEQMAARLRSADKRDPPGGDATFGAPLPLNGRALRRELLSRRRAVSTCLRELGVPQAAIFGSAARGDAVSDSDVDLLLHASRALDAFELLAIQVAVEAIWRRRVHVVVPSEIDSRISRAVYGHAIRLSWRGPFVASAIRLMRRVRLRRIPPIRL
jgi:predicted nucleotidyltransferase